MSTKFTFLTILYVIITGDCKTSLLRHDDSSHNWFVNNVPESKHDFSSTSSHVFAESIPLLSSRTDILKLGRLHHEYVHEVTLAIRPKNMEEVTRVLHDISNPSSPNYGKHWTREQIVDFTSNSEAYVAVVSYLRLRGASIVSETLASEFITVSAPIRLWEAIFNTEFYTFYQTQVSGNVNKVVRAEKYWIPRELEPHIQSVFGVIDLPTKLNGGITKRSKKTILASGKGPWLDDSGITPYKLRSYFNISNSVMGSNFSTQAVYSTAGAFYSPADTLKFQDLAGLPHQIISDVGNRSSDMECLRDGSVCFESNLDIQYITAMSPGSPTTHWYAVHWLTQWLLDLTNTVDPPRVLSISYLVDEKYTTYGDLNAFNTLAIKLSLMGVTIFAASGDYGANNYLAENDPSKCGYEPQFPSVSPYVTSIGATSGPEFGEAEMVCQSNTKIISSGGGFSSKVGVPSFQAAAHAAYFIEAKNLNHTPAAGFAVGRGYPDLSFPGYNYDIIVNGVPNAVCGTSASCPAIAGLFSSINAARNAIGKGSVGWINPVIYSNGSAFTNDVIAGHNRYIGGNTLCAQGFYATPGWDPATGLGSVNYGKMQDLFLSLGDLIGTGTPTSTPSSTPSAAPTETPTESPSSVPTDTPTDLPTDTPTMLPTSVPSAKPTVAPTAKPTMLPTSAPTVKPTVAPTAEPTFRPTSEPTAEPTAMPIAPTHFPTFNPTAMPTAKPTKVPTSSPTPKPTAPPSRNPSKFPSFKPSAAPTGPSWTPTVAPSRPTRTPSTSVPSRNPTFRPSQKPSNVPSRKPTASPSSIPTSKPTHFPSHLPSHSPSHFPSFPPTMSPSDFPTSFPTLSPSATEQPSTFTSQQPTVLSTVAPSVHFDPSPAPSSAPSLFPSPAPTFGVHLPPSRPILFPTSWNPRVRFDTHSVIFTSLAGISSTDVLAPTFPPAVILTVSSLLAVPFSSVFNVRILTKRRTLLADCTIEFSLNITDSVYPSKMYIKVLEESVTTGTFLESLKNSSGIAIGQVNGFTYIDKSPTLSPTQSPVLTSSRSDSGLPLNALVGGGAGAVFLLMLSAIMIYRHKKNKKPSASQLSQVYVAKHDNSEEEKEEDVEEEEEEDYAIQTGRDTIPDPTDPTVSGTGTPRSSTALTLLCTPRSGSGSGFSSPRPSSALCSPRTGSALNSPRTGSALCSPRTGLTSYTPRRGSESAMTTPFTISFENPSIEKMKNKNDQTGNEVRAFYQNQSPTESRKTMRRLSLTPPPPLSNNFII